MSLIVSDEVLLIGLNIFSLADSQLRQILHRHNNSFGGVDVILCGIYVRQALFVINGFFYQQNDLIESTAPSYWHSIPKCFKLTNPCDKTVKVLLNSKQDTNRTTHSK